jgi:hypothetical protein
MMRSTSCALALGATALFLASVAVAEPPDAPASHGPDAVKQGDATKTASKDKPVANDAKGDKPVDAKADKGSKPVDKADPAKADADKAKTADVNAKPTDAPDPAAIAAKKAEREARARTQRDALRPAVMQALKGAAMTDTLRQELKRHAQSLARLERIEQLAVEAKDDPSVERSRALLVKENTRHDTWMKGFDPNAQKVGAK